MGLMDYLLLDEVEDLYQIPKDKLIKYACDGRVSLAVSLDCLGYVEFLDIEDDFKIFDFDGFSLFAYIAQEISPREENTCISVVDITFNQCPIGHPDHSKENDIVLVSRYKEGKHSSTLEKLNTPFGYTKEDGLTIRVGGKTPVFYRDKTPLFLTKDAILNSYFISSLLGIKKEGLKANKDKKEWMRRMVGKDTYEKYEKWQLEVDKMQEKNPHLKHTDICKNLASQLGASFGTIIRNTRLKKPPEK